MNTVQFGAAWFIRPKLFKNGLESKLDSQLGFSNNARSIGVHKAESKTYIREKWVGEEPKGFRYLVYKTKSKHLPNNISFPLTQGDITILTKLKTFSREKYSINTTVDPELFKRGFAMLPLNTVAANDFSKLFGFISQKFENVEN